METKAERLAKVERLYEAIEKAKVSLILEQAKEWLKGFVNEPWYDAAVKAYVDIVSACGRILDDLKRRILKAIEREDLYNDLTDVDVGAAAGQTATAATGVAAAGAIAGTSAAQNIIYYKTWEYLDERYNHVVVDDVRDELIELQKQFRQQLEAVYQKQLADTLIPEASKEMYQSLDMDFDFNKYDEATRDYLRDKKIHWAKQVADETEREIKAQLVKGYEAGLSSYDLAEQIKNSTGFSMHRAEEIARTEVLSACGYASYQAAMADDNIVGHYWRAQNSHRTRSTHRAANGQYRPKGVPFDIGGAQLLFPRDSSLGAPAKEVINCRCHLEMVFADEARNKSPEALHILNDEYKDNKDMKELIKEAFNNIPSAHRKFLDKNIKGIKVVEDGASRYNRFTNEFEINKDARASDLVHEIGHALEVKLDLFHNQKFMGILSKGLEDICITDFKPEIYYTSSDDTDGTEIFVLDMNNSRFSKFVSEYQSRMYDQDYDGNGVLKMRNGKTVLNHGCFMEYFSEGYREYNEDPQNLKQKDPDLYAFIKGVL